MGSWFKKGEEAKRALEEREKLQQQMKEKNYIKFHLKPDMEAPVIFVDDEGFWCEVHIVKTGNGFRTVTCSAGMKPCPVCMQVGDRPHGVICYTIIDLRPFVKKDGTIVKFTKSLLMAKRTLAKQLDDYKKKFGSLVGVKFILKRYTDKDAACGIVKDVVEGKRFNLLGLGKEYAVPYDYEKVLAPPTDEELRYMGFHIIPSVSDVTSDTVIEEDIIEEDITEEEEEEEIPSIVEEEDDVTSEEEESDLSSEDDDEVDVDKILEDLIEEEPKPIKQTGRTKKK
jgi:hypothetical protein